MSSTLLSFFLKKRRSFTLTKQERSSKISEYGKNQPLTFDLEYKLHPPRAF